MNEKNTIQPIDTISSLQNIIIDEIRQKISNAVTDTENTSKEKYLIKEKLIQSANDMNTHEKMNALDKNYDRRVQEHWHNMLYAIISLSVVGIAINTPVALKKNVH